MHVYTHIYISQGATLQPAAVPVVGSAACCHPGGRSEGGIGGGGGGGGGGASRVAGGAPGPAVLPRTWGDR